MPLFLLVVGQLSSSFLSFKTLFHSAILTYHVARAIDTPTYCHKSFKALPNCAVLSYNGTRGGVSISNIALGAMHLVLY